MTTVLLIIAGWAVISVLIGLVGWGLHLKRQERDELYRIWLSDPDYARDISRKDKGD